MLSIQIEFKALNVSALSLGKSESRAIPIRGLSNRMRLNVPEYRKEQRDPLYDERIAIDFYVVVDVERMLDKQEDARAEDLGDS